MPGTRRVGERPLEGRLAVVAGGAGAVGEGVVRALLGAGARVAVPSRHVPLGPEAGLTRYPESYAVATELHNVPLAALRRSRGRLAPGELRALEDAIRIAHGLVHQAHVSGYSWRSIGSVLGTSGGAARQRCGARRTREALRLRPLAGWDRAATKLSAPQSPQVLSRSHRHPKIVRDAPSRPPAQREVLASPLLLALLAGGGGSWRRSV